jgi:hypothetical protein
LKAARINATYQFLPKLQIGAEIFHQTADSSGTPATSSASIGWRFDLNDNYHLLGYVRHGIENANETEKYSWYASATASLPSGVIADVSKKGLKKSPSTDGLLLLMELTISPRVHMAAWHRGAVPGLSRVRGRGEFDRRRHPCYRHERTRDLVKEQISVFLLGQGF